MTLDLPDLDSTAISQEELRLELACALYARGKISALTGSHLAGMELFSFQGVLKDRGVPRNYTLDDLHEDMKSLKKLFPA